MTTPSIVWASIGMIGFASWLFKAWPAFILLVRPRDLQRVRAVARDGTKVSVIVAACNEEKSIRGCLESLLRQDWRPIEVIAVDDRSTDRTGGIMDELAAGDAHLSVIHVTELPPGWLGKNHANWLGAARASGEWILFTDGDILFAPDAIRLALAHAETEGLDHLCLFPRLLCRGFLEASAVCLFGVMLVSALRLHRIRDPLSDGAFCGVGAFNLVHADAYKVIGTHQKLRMEVADDIKLGKLLKREGFVSDALMAPSHLSVRWQEGFSGVVRGLEKNGFAASEYRAGRALAGVFLLMLVVILPCLGAALAPGFSRLPYAAWLLCEMALLSLAAVQNGFRWIVGVAVPVAACGIAYAVGRSTLLALWRGGICWRGTFYPLAELRKGVV
jgi:hypothetical protein